MPLLRFASRAKTGERASPARARIGVRGLARWRASRRSRLKRVRGGRIVYVAADLLWAGGTVELWGDLGLGARLRCSAWRQWLPSRWRRPRPDRSRCRENPSVFDTSTCASVDTAQTSQVSGTVNYLNSEEEPYVAVDPTDGNHLIGQWQQDRWNDGGANGNASSYSLDGGGTWSAVTGLPYTRVAAPERSTTSGRPTRGGRSDRASRRALGARRRRRTSAPRTRSRSRSTRPRSAPPWPRRSLTTSGRP